jgi:hypothetical protein
MRLPRLRRRTATDSTEPTSRPEEPTNSRPTATPAFEVLAYSRSGLPDAEFNAQTETLRRILTYDGDTRSWYGWLPLDQPERAAKILTDMLEAARVHGTTVRVRAHPATESTTPRQVP